MTALRNPRVERSILMRKQALQLAIVRGMVDEEKRIQIGLIREERRRAAAERSEQEFASLLAHMERNGMRRGGKGWLASYAADPRNGIGDHHMRAAEILRDHVQCMTSHGCGEARERVDGGNIHNGQMEGLVDRRRPGRYTLNAAMDAVTDRRLMPGAISVIVWDRSLPWALAYCGITKGSRHYDRMLTAIVEALDAAAAHAGIAR